MPEFLECPDVAKSSGVTRRVARRIPTARRDRRLDYELGRSQPSTGPHHQQGHDLTVELKALVTPVLTCWRLSLTSLTHSRSEVVDPH